MRVFVLSTGRCGSTTFAHACKHLTNFTSGHETRARSRIGRERFDYPDDHIEIDNRLAWFLGTLDALFSDSATYYVWLRRDPDEVARSFLRRWHQVSRRGLRAFVRGLLRPTAETVRSGIVEAFAHSVVMRPEEWPDARKLEVCRFYVETVERNIGSFLKDRRNHMTVELSNAKADFRRFLATIDAGGDLEAAVAEWDIRYNESAPAQG